MKEFFLTLTVTAAVLGFLRLLVPESSRHKKEISFLFALAILFVLLSPLSGGGFSDAFSSFLSRLDTMDYGDTDGKEWLRVESEKTVADAVKSDFCRAFSLDANDVSVTATVENGSITTLRAVLSGKAVFGDLRAMRKYGKENYTESFEVILNLGQ